MAGELPPFSFCHPPEQPRPKPQNLNFADGYPEVRDPEKRKKERMALLENMKDYEYEGGACGDCNVSTGTPTPKWLKYDRQVLRFFCYFKEPVNERREENFRVRKCTIYFYLEDGSMHISEPREDNSGIFQGIFLKRHKVPKHGDGHIGISDFKVGSDITVYERTFRICSCDTFTKEPSPVLPRMEMPPHNGFGTEIDTMQNCISLIPKAPFKDFDKFLHQDGKVFCFSARFAEDETHKVAPPDRGRLFVLKFFLSDDTISIYEPPARNSGIVSGKFLSREAAPKKPGTNQQYQPGDMIVGAKIVIHDRLFELLQADEWTLKYMESHSDEFPCSDYYKVLKKVESLLSKMPDDGLHNLKVDLPTAGNDPTRKLTAIDRIFPLVLRAGINLTKQELVTLDRHISKHPETDVPDIQMLFLKMVSQTMKS